jgi:hypothetical protein
MPPAPIAEATYDVLKSDKKLGARIFAPEPDRTSSDWMCIFEIDDPIGVREKIYGTSSLQALVLSLKTMAAFLYGSELYKQGRLGIYGRFGGHLSVPAPSEFLDKAPYPF